MTASRLLALAALPLLATAWPAAAQFGTSPAGTATAREAAAAPVPANAAAPGSGAEPAGTLTAAAAAAAQSPGGPPKRIQSVIVYGNDPCPPSKGDEIVVCARQPESERYRIPQRFRGAKRQASPASNAWANKVTTAEDASRTAAGVPNSCSAVGSAGQTGCFEKFMAQAAAERRAKKEAEQGIDDGGAGPQ